MTKIKKSDARDEDGMTDLSDFQNAKEESSDSEEDESEFIDTTVRESIAERKSTIRSMKF